MLGNVDGILYSVLLSGSTLVSFGLLPKVYAGPAGFYFLYDTYAPGPGETSLM